MRRRPPRKEPARCSCEPGSNAHKQHAKPGRKVADHTNPLCVHDELQRTLRPAPKRKRVRKFRG